MENKKTSQKILIILGLFILIGVIGGVTYSFFNYTRTGNSNILRVGNISFETSQNGIIELTNAFPIDSSSIDSNLIDENNIGVVKVNINGSTTYNNGIEYVISVENFNNATINNKKIPITISTSVEGVNNKTLGTSTNTYFDENVRENSSVAIYKETDYNNVFDEEQLLVGYIPANTEVQGILTIKAFIDKDKIAITDTIENSNTLRWVGDRTVFTTEEWNYLQESPISFNIKAEANEGIWVEEVVTINSMSNFNPASGIYNDKVGKIQKVVFERMKTSEMINEYNAATFKADLTYNNEGKVLSWLEEVSIQPSTTNSLIPSKKITPQFLSVQQNENIEKVDNETMYILHIVSNGDTYLNNEGSSQTYQLFSNESGIGTFSNTENIIFNNVNTSRLTTMSYMFLDCKKLKSIDLSNLGSDILRNVSKLFYHCNSLKEINMSGFDFGVVTSFALDRTMTNGAPIFYELANVEFIDLSNIKASNVTDAYGMFYKLTSLKEVSLKGADIGSVRSFEMIFALCNELEEIDFTQADTHSVENMYMAFWQCHNISSIKGLDTSNVTNMSMMFYQSEISSIDLSWLNMQSATDISFMFQDCKKLESVNLSNLGGNNLININYIFTQCNKLKNINMSGFNFGKATSMSVLFSGDACGLRELEYVSLNNARALYVTNMSNMFLGSELLKTVDFFDFDSGEVTDMSYMFMRCESLVSIPGFITFENLSGNSFITSFLTTKVTNMSGMFYGCESLLDIDFTLLKTDSVTNMGAMFYGCKNIESINLTGFGSSALTNMADMFKNCSKLKTIIMNNFNFGKTVFYSNGNKSPFYNLTSVEHIYLNNPNFSQISNISSLFQNCSNLVSIELNNWDLRNINYSSVGGLFSGTSSLKTLICRYWKLPSQFTNWLYRQWAAGTIETVDVTGWDLSLTTNISGLFGSGSSLKNVIGLDTWNTSNINDMSDMFNSCTNLTTLDLSSFNINNVSYLGTMFYDCPKLTTIYVSNVWNPSNSVTSGAMFYNNTSLVGGNGTKYVDIANSAQVGTSYIDKDYAVIDKLGQQGFLTLKTN